MGDDDQYAELVMNLVFVQSNYDIKLADGGFALRNGYFQRDELWR